jgi:hypothetical protein
MIKRILFSLLLITGLSSAYAQSTPPPTYSDEEAPLEKKGFKKDHLYLGGSLGLGFGSGQFSIGANPEVGYSLSQWLDAGIVFNINYSSLSGNSYYNNTGISQYIFNYGAGAYLRAYPLRFLFLQIQPEINWVNYSYKGSYAPPSFTTHATSLIAGLGYSQRVIGQANFYTMLGFDLLQDTYSPYRDSYGNAFPIIRAGFTYYLRDNKGRR